jgi:hypothetical protein
MASKARKSIKLGEVSEVKIHLVTIVGSGSCFIDGLRGRVSVIALRIEDYAAKRELLDKNQECFLHFRSVNAGEVCHPEFLSQSKICIL